MSNRLNDLITALRLDFINRKPGKDHGDLWDKFFYDPFCVMKDFSVAPNEVALVLTMSPTPIRAYLEGLNDPECRPQVEWLKELEKSDDNDWVGGGWDAREDIWEDPSTYLSCAARQGPKAAAALAWPGPMQRIREVFVEESGSQFRLVVLGEGLHPEAEIYLNDGKVDKAKLIIEYVHVRAIQCVYLRTEAKPLGTLKGAWKVKVLNPDATATVEYGTWVDLP